VVLSEEELRAIRKRQQVAMAFVGVESETIESVACQGVLIGHDVPCLLDEIERLNRVVDVLEADNHRMTLKMVDLMARSQS
jgi:hypothetical protein